MSERTATALSAEFYSTFQAAKGQITAALEANAVPEAEHRVLDLRRELNAATPYLPAYDLRTCDAQLVDLERQVAGRKALDRPKSKFSFARKATAAPAASFPKDINTDMDVDSQPAASTSNSTPAAVAAAAAHHITDQSNLYLRPEIPFPTGTSSSSYSVILSNLSECIINLLPAAGQPASALTALHANNLRRCIVLAPVIAGSVMMTGLEDCLVVAGCQQFRIHASRQTTILLQVPSHPVIEHSTSLRFGSYPSSLPAPSIPSKHAQVLDFGWLQQTPSPNWTLCDPKDVQDYDVDYAASEWAGPGLSGPMLRAVLNRYLGNFEEGDA